MIRDFVYNMPIIISIMGLLSIFFALKNNNRKNNKLIIIFNTINIIYLFVISTLIHNLLPIIVDLGIIIIWLISIVGGILYIISTIICIVKRKNIWSHKTLDYLIIFINFSFYFQSMHRTNSPFSNFTK